MFQNSQVIFVFAHFLCSVPNKSLNIEDSIGFVEPRVGRASIHLGSNHGFITLLALSELLMIMESWYFYL